MERDAFIARYPRLFHMAAEGSWPSIQERGLLATRTLVDLYDPPQDVRAAILDRVRRRGHVLTATGLPDAMVRDQLPLKFLDRCLLPGVSVQDYLDELNGRVFFHVTEVRLHTLLGARAYRKHTHDVITLDTRMFLDLHPDVDLAPYNTGSVHVPNMPARGPSTFTRLEAYSWQDWRKKRGEANAVVELTVAHSANVDPAVLKVEQWHVGKRVEVLLSR